MRKFRAVFLSGLMGALALGGLASPAAAANPRLAFVNGIPGKTVDVCVGNTEVKSNLRYGRWAQATASPGNRTVKFRNAAPGTCNGSTVARRSLDLVADADVTLVATPSTPKVVAFNNKSAPAPVGNINWISVRQASDVGSVMFAITAGSTVTPSAPPAVFAKGEQWRSSFGAGANLPITFAAYKPSKASPFVGPEQYLTYEGRRHEIILVGSKPSNARFVAVVRPTIAP